MMIVANDYGYTDLFLHFASLFDYLFQWPILILEYFIDRPHLRIHSDFFFLISRFNHWVSRLFFYCQIISVGQRKYCFHQQNYLILRIKLRFSRSQFLRLRINATCLLTKIVFCCPEKQMHFFMKLFECNFVNDLYRQKTFIVNKLYFKYIVNISRLFNIQIDHKVQLQLVYYFSFILHTLHIIVICNIMNCK